MSSVRTILAVSALSLLLLPSIASAEKCEGFWECSWGIAKSTGKLAGKAFTRTGAVVIAGATGAAEAISDDEDVLGVIGGTLGGAGKKVVEAVGDTAEDIGELGSAVYDATTD